MQGLGKGPVAGTQGRQSFDRTGQHGRSALQGPSARSSRGQHNRWILVLASIHPFRPAPCCLLRYLVGHDQQRVAALHAARLHLPHHHGAHVAVLVNEGHPGRQGGGDRGDGSGGMRQRGRRG